MSVLGRMLGGSAMAGRPQRRSGTYSAYPYEVSNLDTVVADLVLLGGDPERSASSAGLSYIAEMTSCLRRMRVGKGVRYVDAAGKAVTDATTLERIRALAIPPAWTDVQICARPNGHIQATGRDAKGRKQYRYHPSWRALRDETKFGRMIAFAEALPTIRARVARDLSLPGLSREKILATLTQLLERTLIRVGNEEYAQQNRSYGLTTLRAKHARVEGPTIHFHFRGKSGKEHVIDVKDRRLAAVVRRCQELPGQELFCYTDEDGVVHTVESADVNGYLRDAARDDFSAKDFRTWYGTLLAARALGERATRGKPLKKHVVAAIAHVASSLGNTPSVCRKSYIHPAVISRYLGGKLAPIARTATRDVVRGKHALVADERALLKLLKEELAIGRRPLASALRASLQQRSGASPTGGKTPRARAAA